MSFAAAEAGTKIPRITKKKTSKREAVCQGKCALATWTWLPCSFTIAPQRDVRCALSRGYPLSKSKVTNGHGGAQLAAGLLNGQVNPPVPLARIMPRLMRDGRRFNDHLNDSPLLRGLYLRIHGQREDFRSDSFGNGEISLSVTKVRVGLLKMKGKGIVNPSVDLCLGKVFLNSLAISYADYIKAVNRARPTRLGWSDNTANGRKHFMISLCGLSPFAIPFREVTKLHGQDSCLDGIESAVIPFDIVEILLRLAMFTQHSDLARHLFIVCCHRSGFATGAKVLSRVKAEGSGTAHRPRFPPTALSFGKVFRAMGLASVFDHDQVVSFCEI